MERYYDHIAQSIVGPETEIAGLKGLLTKILEDQVNDKADLRQASEDSALKTKQELESQLSQLQAGLTTAFDDKLEERLKSTDQGFNKRITAM